MTEQEVSEELQYYIGMNTDDAVADLVDKEIVYRVLAAGDIYTMEYNPNRVNLKIDASENVVSAFYG